MTTDHSSILKKLHPSKVLVPVALGIAFLVWVIFNDERFDEESLRLIADVGLGALLMSFPILLLRDIGYVYRIRAITDGEVSLKGSIYTVVLWEFASAVTPSIVGGTAVAAFILMKEGLTLGKSMAYILFTSILDNLFFVICAPMAILLIGRDVFPAKTLLADQLGNGLPYFFWISYTMISVYTVLMTYGLFLRPRAFKWTLIKLTSLKWLRKWRTKAARQGEEIVRASQLITSKSRKYWVKALGSTIVIWSSRYLLINFIAMSFMELSFSDHLMIFGRQAVLWVMMLVSITPGGSGLAELFFDAFYFELFLKYTLAVAVLWRLFSYYPFLAAGIIALPKWIKRVFAK